jgi:flagellar protein FliO/FliZ
MTLLLMSNAKRKITIAKSLLALVFLFFVDFSSAAEEVVPPISYSSSMIKMMMGLAATIVMIFVVVWLIKRVGYTGYNQTNGMKITSTLALSSKEKLVVIEVEGEKILIGVAPGFVGLVKTLEPDTQKQALMTENAALSQNGLIRSNIDGANSSDETMPNAAFSRHKVVNDLSSSFAEKLKAVLNKGDTVG